VDAALEGLHAGIADGCDYFVLISGQDFPLRPIKEIVAFTEAAGTRSYMGYWPLSALIHKYHGRDRTEFYTYSVLGRRETCIPHGEDTSYFNLRGRLLNTALRLPTALKPPRRFPSYLEPFAGVTWWNLSRVAAEYVVSFLGNHPDYRRYHSHTRIPEEIFFSSILVGTDFVRRYEVVNDALRFLLWGEGIHPRTLRTSDLAEMLRSDALFGRKFDSTEDSDVLAQLASKVAG
jgi:hypothetical protein